MLYIVTSHILRKHGYSFCYRCSFPFFQKENFLLRKIVTNIQILSDTQFPAILLLPGICRNITGYYQLFDGIPSFGWEIRRIRNQTPLLRFFSRVLRVYSKILSGKIDWPIFSTKWARYHNTRISVAWAYKNILYRNIQILKRWYI